VTEPVKAAVRTLGCKVNRAESETIVAELLGRGVLLAGEDEADVIVVNTCTVTGEADAKARKAIRQALAASKSPLVVVTGCLAAVDAAMLEALGDRVVVEADKRRVTARVSERLFLADKGAPVTRTGPAFRTRVMLKIQDGCDAFCSYCIVPSARGVPVSVPLADVAREAAGLAAAGVKEVVLTGVNLGRYADGGARLGEVVSAVAAAGIGRIRLSSIEPQDLTDEFLGVLSELPGVCPHLHVPLQSGSDAVLGRMNRGYDVERFEQRIAAARQALDGLAVTTDVIVGFPGESDADFEMTRAACERIGFAKLHVFRYSARKRTPAADLADQVAPAVRRERAASLSEAGNSLRTSYLESRVGAETEILVEKRVGDVVTGTAPDYCSVSAAGALGARAGELLRVRLVGARAGALIGEIV
jgi:threonylcarbamoyladenosine tRNA methylthiotransferase MtaB